MPRIRSVHPDLHRDKTLAQVSASAERTFVRLWCHLDDEGRGEDDPDLLKADLYPRHRDMDADAIDADLDELAAYGLVIRYQVDGERYLCCKPETWSTYQRPQKKQDSKLPGPDADGAVITPVPNQDDTATRPVSPVGEGRGEGVGGEKEREGSVAPDKPSRPPAKRKANDEHSQLFQALVDVCGLDPPLTKHEGGRVGTAAKQLREIGATPDDVRQRAGAYRKRYGDEVELTPTGLVSNWAQVVASRNGHRRAPPSPDACQQCGQGKSDHDAQLCKILAEAS